MGHFATRGMRRETLYLSRKVKHVAFVGAAKSAPTKPAVFGTLL